MHHRSHSPSKANLPSSLVFWPSSILPIRATPRSNSTATTSSESYYEIKLSVISRVISLQLRSRPPLFNVHIKNRRQQCRTTMTKRKLNPGALRRGRHVVSLATREALQQRGLDPNYTARARPGPPLGPLDRLRARFAGCRPT